MKNKKIIGAATSFAVIAIIGSSAHAQTNVKLPAELEALNLSDIRSDEKREGFVEIEGRSADGYEIEALVDAQGKLVKIEVDDGEMPQSLTNTFLPQAVRDNELMTQFVTIDSLHSRRGNFGVQGEDSAGDDLYALFAEDGRMMRFGRDDDDDHMHGKKHREGMMKRGKMMHDGKGKPEEHARRMAPAPEFEPTEVNKKLTEAGYKDFGFMHVRGPRVMLEATNPQGEPVMLELDPKGEVVRETAR